MENLLRKSREMNENGEKWEGETRKRNFIEVNGKSEYYSDIYEWVESLCEEICLRLIVRQLNRHLGRKRAPPYSKDTFFVKLGQMRTIQTNVCGAPSDKIQRSVEFHFPLFLLNDGKWKYVIVLVRSRLDRKLLAFS